MAELRPGLIYLIRAYPLLWEEVHNLEVGFVTVLDTSRLLWPSRFGCGLLGLTLRDNLTLESLKPLTCLRH